MCLRLHGAADSNFEFASDFEFRTSDFRVGCMSSHASQSSNSGCEGGSLCIPKSSGVVTIPMPKYACHRRLTTARAVVGERPSMSHFANASRDSPALLFWLL